MADCQEAARRARDDALLSRDWSELRMAVVDLKEVMIVAVEIKALPDQILSTDSLLKLARKERAGGQTLDEIASQGYQGRRAIGRA